MAFTDKKIIEAIENGDSEKALSLLYKKELPRVRKYIMANKGSLQDANDVFQDAVMILYRKVNENQIDYSQGVSGFMFTVSRNLWRRKAVRDQRVVYSDEPTEMQSDLDIEQELIGDEKRSAIKQIFERVGEPCQTLLKLSIFEEKPLAEIAEIMSYSSTDVVKTYAYRCRKKLADLMSKKKGFIQLFDL